MKKLISALLLIIVTTILCTSCNYVMMSKEDYNTLLNAVKEKVEVVEKTAAEEPRNTESSKDEQSKVETIDVDYHESFCTTVVRSFMNDFYTFSPVTEDVKAKDIVWVWNNTDGKLTIQFKDYVIGRKQKDVEVIVLQMTTQEQADRLAIFLNEVYDDWEANNDMLIDRCAKSYKDNVVVISTFGMIEKVDRLSTK